MTVILGALAPLGLWGLGILSIIDSAAIFVPIDALVIDYSVKDHPKFLVYCFVAALGAAIGSLLPFFIGRAGGELFLMKRINRTRYEQLRDRFERQEFLAIMIPAMMPPPMPVKVFEIAAGVFEMRTFSFFSAILLGKFVRFGAVATIAVLYGPQIVRTIQATVRGHLGYMLASVGVLVVLIAIWVARKVFDRKKGVRLPVEEDLPPVEDK